MVGTWELGSKICLIVVVLTCTVKTLRFMRVFGPFSYIVKMISSVVGYLKVFILFFVILIIFFSLLFDIISPNNAEEYRHIGRFFGNVLTTLRISLGDFDFSVLEDHGPNLTTLNTKQHVIFWLCWVMICVFSSLIFLNFIIAEVCDVYVMVKQDILPYNYKEKAGMINEAQLFHSKKTKREDYNKYPKYIVIREKEE